MKGLHINLEYVSANPTGPVHLGGARWAAVGDSLARLMKASGAKVTREYYFNDHGSQIDRFARSLYARAMGHEAPEDGYGGQDVYKRQGPTLYRGVCVLMNSRRRLKFSFLMMGPTTLLQA